MTCHICNMFQGQWRITSEVKFTASDPAPDFDDRGSRNHICNEFTWDELVTSAKSCYCCEILVAGCHGCFHQHNISEHNIGSGNIAFIYPPFTNDHEADDADKTLVFELSDGSRFDIEMFAAATPECPIPPSWDCMPISWRTSPQTDSQEAIDLIQEWMEICTSEHDFCESLQAPQLPTRVVDVGLNNGIIKLVEPDQARARYICLSHCWGLSQIITTTKSTLQERKEQIKWEELSETFQDAISLTRKLGFEYIWIDSLCIIQDDPQDWEVESAKMASVYSNGYFTIAATHSSNGRGGLFTRTLDFGVSGLTPNGESYHLFFRERIDHHLEIVGGLITEGGGFQTVLRYPLLTRAWVYQERILSTRVIHFGYHEVFFECKSSILCECGAIAQHGSTESAASVLIKHECAQVLDESWEECPEDHMYALQKVWRTVVCNYSALFLTMSKDRLPAIGGVASQMFDKRKSRYLAGIWEDSLNDDLIWAVTCPSKEKKPRKYPRNSPTWSWASVGTWVSYWDVILYTNTDEGELPVSEYERPPYQHFSKIHNCEVLSSAVDEFGTVADGSLTISGLVSKGVLEREVSTSDGKDGVVHYISFATARQAIKSDYLLDHEGPGQTLAGTELLCLRMSCIQEGSTERLISLVLRASPDTQGSYERIGTVIINARPPPVDTIGEIFRDAREQTLTIV